jgi:hypothetical protein
MKVSKSIAVNLLALIVLGCSSGFAKPSQDQEARDAQIRIALEGLNGGAPPSYKVGWYDLNADGEDEAVVMMLGGDWCGSGGCTLFVMEHHTASWEVVSRNPTSRPPVAVLPGSSNGWRDLSVTTQGGGDLVKREVVLKFQGSEYVKHPEIQLGNQQTVIIPAP